MPRQSALIMFFLAYCLGIAGCARTPPEQALRDAIAEGRAAIETRDGAAVQALLAEDFVGNDGLDREGARRLAQALFLRHRDIALQTGPLDIELQESHARVRFSAALVGGRGALLPEAGQFYDVDTGWRLEEGEWRLVSATWRPRL